MLLLFWGKKSYEGNYITSKFLLMIFFTVLWSFLLYPAPFWRVYTVSAQLVGLSYLAYFS